MIEITDKKKCCGCTACQHICPKSCISMEEKDDGFLYPIVDKKKCINCNLCERVCQYVNIIKHNDLPRRAFVAQNKNEIIRKESTSGGIFSSIAEEIIKNNGIVYGASFDNDYFVIHSSANTISQLKKFRGSKYVQSHLGNVFKEIKEYLDNNILICFSGTPCQVEGLKQFLIKDYKNLITVDLVCHGVPSPKLYKSYLNYQKKKHNDNNITFIHFRDKFLGYLSSTMTIKFENGKIYRNGVSTDPLLYSFFHGLSTRNSCFNCQQKLLERNADITLFDAWSVKEFDKVMDDDKGTTAIITHSKTGNDIIDKIKYGVDLKEVDINRLVELDGDMILKTPKKHELHDKMLKETTLDNFNYILKKYIKISSSAKIRAKIKPFFYKVGVFQLYMFLKNRFIKGKYQD